MKITRVTVTGADDEVPIDSLLALSREFPFVEWGILVSQSRSGTPRYPSTKWLKEFGVAIRCEYQHFQRPVAIHLCGMFARWALAGFAELVAGGTDGPVPWLGLHSRDFWRRVQLNGFSDYHVPLLRVARLCPDLEFILQCKDDAALANAAELRDQHSNISALWDTSGGEGVPIELDLAHLTLGLLPTGFAGGIGPDNIQTVAERVIGLGDADDPTWLDAESGWRTDNHFDLAKVRAGLEAIRPFIAA